MSIDSDGWRNVLNAKTPARVTSERTQELVKRAFGALTQTRALQDVVRQFIRGHLTPDYPSGVASAIAKSNVAGRNDLVPYHSPQSAMIPLEMIGQLARTWPVLKRGDVASGTEPERISNRIERIHTGVMAERFDYAGSCDLILNDGEAGSWWLPSVEHWADPQDTWDVIHPDEWAHLPDDLRRLWEWKPGPDGGMDGSTYRRIARKYRRDADGRPEWDDEYQPPDGSKGRSFVQDNDRTAEAIYDSVRRRIESRIPLECEIFDYSVMAPLNPRWENGRLVVDGLATMETFDGTDLYRRGYRWGERQETLWLPSDRMAKGGPSTLYRLVMLDGDGCPYLVASIDGLRTERVGQNAEWSEIVSLGDLYGYDFLPVAYRYGLHFRSRSPDQRVVPYMNTLMGALLLRDKLMTLLDYHNGQMAWGGWWMKPDPAILGELPMSAVPETIKAEAMTAKKVWGDMVPAVHPGPGRGIEVERAYLDQDLQQAGPNPASQGGPGANSAIERAMISRDEKRGMYLVWHGIDGFYEDNATHAGRALACLSRQINEPLKLNLLTETPGELTMRTSPKRNPIVIDPELWGGDYTVWATRPGKWGDDPNTQTLLMAAVEKGFASPWRLFDAVGVTDTNQEIAEIITWAYLTKDPAGREQIMAIAEQMNTDVQAAVRRKLKEQNMVDEAGQPITQGGSVMNREQAMVRLNLGQPGVGSDGRTVNPAAQSNAGAYGGSVARGPVNRIVAGGGDASDLSMAGG